MINPEDFKIDASELTRLGKAEKDIEMVLPKNFYGVKLDSDLLGCGLCRIPLQLEKFLTDEDRKILTESDSIRFTLKEIDLDGLYKKYVKDSDSLFQLFKDIQEPIEVKKMIKEIKRLNIVYQEKIDLLYEKKKEEEKAISDLLYSFWHSDIWRKIAVQKMMKRLAEGMPNNFTPEFDKSIFDEINNLRKLNSDKAADLLRKSTIKLENLNLESLYNMINNEATAEEAVPAFIQSFTEEDYMTLYGALSLSLAYSGIKKVKEKKLHEEYIEQRAYLLKSLSHVTNYKEAKGIIEEIGKLNTPYRQLRNSLFQKNEEYEALINTLIFNFVQSNIWTDQMMNKVIKEFDKQVIFGANISASEFFDISRFSISKNPLKAVDNTRKWYAKEARKLLYEIKDKDPEMLQEMTSELIYQMIRNRSTIK